MSGTTTKPMTPATGTAPSGQSQMTAVPPLGPERPVAWPKREVHTLSNGMQVVLAELRTFPKISAQLFFRSGNASVAHRAPGLAEITPAPGATQSGLSGLSLRAKCWLPLKIAVFRFESIAPTASDGG